jgi:hypothetical protein
METVTKHSDNYEQIDIYKYFKYTNVYKYEDIQCNSYNIYYDSSLTLPNNSSDKEYYLILDTTFSEALFHWFVECIIFLPLYIELQKKYPTLKMIFKIKADYHKIILEYYNIPYENVLYKIENNNNECFFPLPISQLNDKVLDDEYVLYSNAFLKWFNNIHFDKTIDHLIMPRQVLQNSDANPRSHNCDDIINRMSHMPNTVVFHTDKMTDFYEQHKLVKSSKTIIVSDGSPCLFNGLLAENSTIIILGFVVLDQAEIYPKFNFFVELIAQKNNVIFIPYLHGDFFNSTFYYNDIRGFIEV